MKSNSFESIETLAVSTDPDRRESAARNLAEFSSDPDARNLLFRLLGDRDWRVRRAAVETFLESQGNESIPALLDALYEEENAGKRNAAIDILTRMGKQIVPFVGTHLSSGNTDVRMFLIQILGELRNSDHLKDVVASLKDQEPNIVSAAILALGKIGHPEALASIAKFLREDEIWTKLPAIEAAGEIRDPSVISDLIILCESPYCRRPVIRALGKIHHEDSYKELVRLLTSENRLDTDALESLLDLYSEPQPDQLKQITQEQIKNSCRKYLNQDAKTILFRELHAAGNETKRHLIQFLGWSQAGEAVPLLLEMMRDPNLQDAATFALNDCAGAADLRFQEGIKTFLADSDEGTRYQAFLILRNCPGVGLETWMSGALDSYPPIRKIAGERVLALCAEDPSRLENVRQTFLRALQSDRDSRAAAVDFLGQPAFPDSASVLLQAIKDEDPVVRRQSVESMGKWKDDRFERSLIIALADEDARVRETAAHSLRNHSSSESREALISSIQDEDPWVRTSVYETLSHFGENETVAEALRKQVEKENPVALGNLLKSITIIECIHSKKYILNYLNSPDPGVRKAICEGLAHCSGSDVDAALMRIATNDPHWDTRVAAIRSLAGRNIPDLSAVLLDRLESDSDSSVRSAILESLRNLPLHHLPRKVFEFLADPDLCNAAFLLLSAKRSELEAQIREEALRQTASVRRILQFLLS